MATWNYRVVRTSHTEGTSFEPYATFAIHEAHYDTPSEVPGTITVDPVTTYFDSVDDLRDALTKMLASLDKPVLNYEDF